MSKDGMLPSPPVCYDIDVRWLPMVTGALSITFNRPTKKNALRSQSYHELSHALDFASSCAHAACVVITGSGDYFTAGADLQDNVLGQFESPCDVMALPVSRFFKSLIECSVPVIACVQGPAVGVGVTMLLLCDAVYASSAATFWTPFARSGLAPEFASALLFPAAMGNTAASEMILCSKKMSAVDAAACRLVGAVFPPNSFQEECAVRVTMFTSCGGVGQAGVGAARRTLQLYKSLMRPQSLKTALIEQHKCEMQAIAQRIEAGETLQLMMMWTSKKASNL